MRDMMILAPILLLFGVGLFIALGSGDRSEDKRRAGRMHALAGNFSSAALRVVGYLALLMMVQHVVGFPLFSAW